MNKRCTSSFCKDGNCIGCKDGIRWCEDPRCHPRCEDCEKPRSTFKFGIIVFFIVIIFVIITGFIIYYYKYHENTFIL